MPTPIYHFTHMDNLASIFEFGWLRCDTAVRNAGRLAVDVGNRDIKARRRELPVPCGRRGVVADYVPFYFAPRSPMLYAIYRGAVPEYPDGQRPLVYLVSTVEQVQADRRPVVFSEGNAGARITEFFTDPADLETRIDWPLMSATMWHDTADDGDRRRRRMAEVLVHDRFSTSSIHSIACFNDAVADRVAVMLEGLGPDVEIRAERGWFF